MRGSGVATTVAAFGVLHPTAERLIRDPKILGNAGQGSITAANKANRLSFELWGIAWLGAGQTTTASWASYAQ